MAFINARPKYFAEIMANLLFWLGEDRILFGTDYAIWSPKWIIDRFMDFQLPGDIQEEFGVELTPCGKAQDYGREHRPPLRHRRHRPSGQVGRRRDWGTLGGPIMTSVNRAPVHEVTGVDVVEECYRRGWTDGLPVAPPTVEKVAAMLEYVGLEPDRMLGEVPVRRRTLTAEQAAANAVMAGCLPEYFPVVLAVMRAMFEYDPNCIHEASAATNSPGILVLVNGPIRRQIELNCAGNLFSPGHRANSTIGRAIRLILINVFEQRPNVLDRGCMGALTKFGVCFGEDEREQSLGAVPCLPGLQGRGVYRDGCHHPGPPRCWATAMAPPPKASWTPPPTPWPPTALASTCTTPLGFGSWAIGTPRCWAGRAGTVGAFRNTSGSGLGGSRAQMKRLGAVNGAVTPEDESTRITAAAPPRRHPDRQGRRRQRHLQRAYYELSWSPGGHGAHRATQLESGKLLPTGIIASADGFIRNLSWFIVER